MATIQPTRIELPLGGSIHYGADLKPGVMELDTEASYTFEVTADGKTYSARGTYVRHWDAATGVAFLQPQIVMVGGNS